MTNAQVTTKVNVVSIVKVDCKLLSSLLNLISSSLELFGSHVSALWDVIKKAVKQSLFGQGSQ